MLRPTKASIRKHYLDGLKATYPFYTPGSNALHTAELAIDAALEGRTKLKGDCFSRALEAHGLRSTSSKATLAALPDL